MNNTLKLTIKLAWKGLTHNWGRSLLTMLGIIIGVASVITIMAVGDGAQNLLTNTITKAGTKNLSIRSGNPKLKIAQGIQTKSLTLDDAEVLSSIPHVENIDTQDGTSFDVLYKGDRINTNINGTSENYPDVQNHLVLLGRFYTKEEVRSSKKVAVLGYKIATELFKNKNPIGESIKIGNESFNIIGVLEEKGAVMFGSPDDTVLIPIETLQKRFTNKNKINVITLKLDDEKNIPRTTETIKAKLRYRHKIDDPEDDDFQVISISQTLEITEGITNAVSAFLAIIAGISLLVGGIGIMNIMLMNVNQRTREIGLRKALGAKPKMIQQQFLIESLVLTLLGGGIGTLIGIFISWGIAIGAQYAGYDWAFQIRPEAILLGVGIAGITGYVFGSGPAKKAAQLNAIDALRYE